MNFFFAYSSELHTTQGQITTNMSRNQTYNMYKQYEDMALDAVEKGEHLRAETFFLKAAAGRKEFCEKFCGGRWDAGHKARYDSMMGAAWIQRQALEDDKIVDEICYERDAPQQCGTYNVWKKKSWRNKKENFNALLTQHAKIQKKRRHNAANNVSSLVSAFSIVTI